MTEKNGTEPLSSPPAPAVPGRVFWRWVPLAGAAVVGITLMSAVLFMRSTLQSAAGLVASGQGEALALLGRMSWRSEAGPPRSRQLDRFLREHREEGLRYVALITPDGRSMAEAGEAEGRSLVLGRQDLGGRLRQVLDACGGNRKEAAEKLGIGLRTLYDKLRKYRGDEELDEP